MIARGIRVMAMPDIAKAVDQVSDSIRGQYEPTDMLTVEQVNWILDDVANNVRKTYGELLVKHRNATKAQEEK